MDLLCVEGFSLSLRQQELLRDYLSLVLDWNRRINLTSRRRTDRFLEEQVLGSLDYLRAHEFPQKGRVMDLGSGAGLPGIPIKIARPDLQITLLEARQKRAAFLAHVIRTLGLEGIRCVNQRAEWAKQDTAMLGVYDVITARAIGPLARTMIWARPFLREGGMLVVAKGAEWAEEVQEIEEDLHELGFKAPKIVPRRCAGRMRLTFHLILERLAR